jgi:hypothetical protein
MGVAKQPSCVDLVVSMTLWRRRTIYLILLFALNAFSVAPLQAQNQATGGARDLTFKIKVPLEFKGRAVSGSLRQSEIEKLFDLPVRNGAADYGVEMTRPDYTTFKVYTCREWKKSHAQNAYSATTFDMAMEGFLLRTCGLLFELQKARLPAKSFITKVSLANMDLLPADMLNEETDNAESAPANVTVSKVVPRADIEEASDNGITLTYGNFRQSFWEGARADFNGDGIEDILVFTGGRAVGGTLGYSDFFFLTRTRASGPLTIFRHTEP